MSGPDLPDNPSRDDLERLSRWAGVPLEELVALSHFRDPFLVGTPTHTADASRFVSLVEFLRGSTGVNPDDHLRDVHYSLISTHAAYSEHEWEWLVTAAGRARDLGEIEPWAFPDKRTRALLLNGRGEGEEIEYTITKPTFHVPTRAWVGEAEVDGFSALRAQPVRVLGLVEKDSERLRDEIVGRSTARARSFGSRRASHRRRSRLGWRRRRPWTRARSSCSRSPTPTSRAST